MRGRQPCPMRAAAIAAGESHYLGSECKRCGGTLRYISNWGCVACNERKKQLKRGTTYQGQPCVKNHDGRRYKKSGQCVQCKLDAAAAQRQARKTPQKRVAAPVSSRLAIFRAEQTARQRRAMGLEA